MTAQPRREQLQPKETREEHEPIDIQETLNEWVSVHETADPDTRSDIKQYLQTNLESLNEIQHKTNEGEKWAESLEKALDQISTEESEYTELDEEDIEIIADIDELKSRKQELEGTLQTFENVDFEVSASLKQSLEERLEEVNDLLSIENPTPEQKKEMSRLIDDEVYNELEKAVARVEQAKQDEEKLEKARSKVEEVAQKIAGHAKEGKFERKGSQDRLETREYDIGKQDESTPEKSKAELNEDTQDWLDEGDKYTDVAEEIGVDLSGLQELKRQWQRVKENSDLIVDENLKKWVESPKSSWETFMQADPDQGLFKKIGGFFSGDKRTQREKMSDRMAEAYYQIADKTADVSSKLAAQKDRQKQSERQSKKTGSGSMT
jgi:hypothetical protein